MLEKPRVRFEEERDLLIPLPVARFSPTIRELRKVSWDCLVSFRAVRYSCPHRFAGKRVWVRESHGSVLEVMDLSGSVITRHSLSDKKGATIIQKEHPPLTAKLASYWFCKRSNFSLKLINCSLPFSKKLFLSAFDRK